MRLSKFQVSYLKVLALAATFGGWLVTNTLERALTSERLRLTTAVELEDSIAQEIATHRSLRDIERALIALRGGALSNLSEPCPDCQVPRSKYAQPPAIGCSGG